LVSINKQHLFLDVFDMPSKTISSWNTYPVDNYRIFAIATLENISLIYSFKGYIAAYKEDRLNENNSDIFLKNLIDCYFGILDKLALLLNNKKLSKKDKSLLLEIIDESLADEVVKKLDVWKYYNKTICKRSLKRRRLHLTALLFILIVLSDFDTPPNI